MQKLWQRKSALSYTFFTYLPYHTLHLGYE